jgi:hypothetical protein
LNSGIFRLLGTEQHVGAKDRDGTKSPTNRVRWLGLSSPSRAMSTTMEQTQNKVLPETAERASELEVKGKNQ